jgi:ribonucleoside-triphosphate reductase
MAKYATGLTKPFLKKYEELTPPWGEVGYVTYKRTYARKIEELGRTEEWNETCERVCRGLVDIGGAFTQAELESLYDHLFNLRGSTSGRALWQLGTATVKRIGADSLQNCWHVTVNDLSAFTFTFNQLMLGGGVGFNLMPEYVYELPTVKYDVIVERVDTPDCDFLVPDNREGWVELLERTLQAFFVTGKPLRYYTKNIREKGKPIKSFGGVASGSEDLVHGIEKIAKIIRARHRNKLRPIDCLDILNIIGHVVVSGNVRRSAEIAIGDINDRLFLDAKNWSKHSIPNWRAMSNNSIACDDVRDLLPEFWGGYRGEGEPYGLINLNNCRRFGRLVDGEHYRPDPTVVGVNPCAEITLAHKEPCNLADIFLPNVADGKQLCEIATLLYKVCKTISCVGFSDPVTDAIVKENHRLGIGLTGWMAAPLFHDAQILNDAYRAIEAEDKEYSREMGVKESIKLTTMKPSGTLSLLPRAVTPGVHAAFSKHLIRRIRFAANDPLVERCMAHGYEVEPLLQMDGSYDYDTTVVSFPMMFPDHVVTEEQVTVIDELNEQLFLQTHWADNSVSATHYFKEHELPVLQNWLEEHYQDEVKTCSFLLSEEHGFLQAPLEKISREKYEEMVASCTPITRFDDQQERDLVDTLECAGGHCPVK